MVHSLVRAAGIARSLAIYYGKPGRQMRQRRHYRAFVQPGDLCFDIGAHVGSRARCFARLGARVVAVEPQPYFARLLRVLYGRRADITIVEAAVGAAEGEGVLHVSRRTPTVSTLSQAWIEDARRDPSFAQVAWDRNVTVQATTLDALIARFGTPSFCKIDIEGHEAEALRGLSTPIRGLSFEYTPAVPAVGISCVERMATLGPYRFNVSVGESLRWALPRWVGPDDIRSWLAGRVVGERSGDVYACLAKEDSTPGARWSGAARTE